ncbi:MAG: thiamine ABC transporter substrate-binding protein, partial [Bdellovibrio sp.]
VLAFVGRTSELSPMPRSFEDLLQERFRNQISLPDPRTSSLGYQLLLWLKEVRGESGAFDFLKKFLKQVKMISPGWSLSYGIFQKKQALLTLSYVTSPIYHLLEEKTTDVVALEFQEGHPVQVEFAGVPASCRNCELADRFLALLLSPVGQKILMEKNYMFPVLESVRRQGVFAQVPSYKLLSRNPLPSSQERETLLKSWTHLRRSLE